MPIIDEEQQKATLAAQPLQAGAQPVAPKPQQQAQPSQGGQAVGGPGSAFTQGQTQQPQQDPNKAKSGVGTGASSLQKFLQANEGQGQQMMGQVQGQAGQQAANIQQNVANQQSDLMQRINANRDMFQNAYNTVMGQPQPTGAVGGPVPINPDAMAVPPEGEPAPVISPIEQGLSLQDAIAGMGEGQSLLDLGLSQDQIDQISGLYSDAGGTGDSVDFTEGLGYDQSALAKLQHEADQAASMYEGLGGEDFRKQILQETFGQGGKDYSRGMSGLDAMLMGQGVPEAEQREFLETMQGMGEDTQDAIRQAQVEGKGAIGDLKGDETAFEQALKEQLEGAYGTKQEDDPTTDIDESQLWDEGGLMGGLQDSAELEQGLREAFDSGEMTLEQIQAIMGEEFNPGDVDNFSLYGADMGDSFGPEYDQITPEMMATSEQDAQMQAYGDLMGQEVQTVDDASKITAGPDRFEDFANEVASNKESYEQQLPGLESAASHANKMASLAQQMAHDGRAHHFKVSDPKYFPLKSYDLGYGPIWYDIESSGIHAWSLGRARNAANNANSNVSNLKNKYGMNNLIKLLQEEDIDPEQIEEILPELLEEEE